MYLIRLDDASEHMNIDNWLKIKVLLDKYGIKPIFGIIPNNQDTELLKYDTVYGFWEMMIRWQKEGWVPALHGYTHVFETREGGMNPINHKSEFAGLPLERQKEKIKRGYQILKERGIDPEIFFAPAHTFDANTLKALYEETPIRVVSDTIAVDIYYKKPFYFIPQQSGRVRKLPFKTVTFCYHPNEMKDDDFERLERFLERGNRNHFFKGKLKLKKRKLMLRDILIRKVYFMLKNMRNMCKTVRNMRNGYDQ